MNKSIQLMLALTAATATANAAVIKIDGSNGIATTDESGRLIIDSSKTLTTGNDYILTEITYVTGGTLTIEKGVIIRGEQKTSGQNDPGSLVITRDGQIDVQGTAAEPVIMTTAALDNDGNSLPDRVGGVDTNTAADYVDWSSSSDTFLDSDPLNSPLPPYLGWDTADRYTPPAAVLEYRGMWGGLIVLGKAPNSISEVDSNGQVGATSKADKSAAPSQLDEIFEGYIEGIAPATSGEYGVYGGRNPHDSSGSITYLSIRHGGSDIGDGNEINGLTLGSCGDGTRIENVEVYCNADDGFEWFGGCVNCKYLVGLFNNDDTFDKDEGFMGHGQFWFSLQIDDNLNGDHGAEHDGTDALFESVGVAGMDVEGDNGGGLYLAHSTVYNATYIGAGAGQDTTPDSGANSAFRIRDSWGGGYYNSIFTDFGGYAVRVDGDNAARFAAGDVSFKSNIFYNFALDGGTAFDATPTTAELAKEGAGSNAEAILANTGDNFSGNTINVDPFDSRRNGIAGIPFLGIADTPAKFDRRTGLDPRPDTGVTEVVSDLEDELATFFTDVAYKGAFEPTAATLWTDGWTAASALGVISKQ